MPENPSESNSNSPANEDTDPLKETVEDLDQTSANPPIDLGKTDAYRGEVFNPSLLKHKKEPPKEDDFEVELDREMFQEPVGLPPDTENETVEAYIKNQKEKLEVRRRRIEAAKHLNGLGKSRLKKP